MCEISLIHHRVGSPWVRTYVVYWEHWLALPGQTKVADHLLSELRSILRVWTPLQKNAEQLQINAAEKSARFWQDKQWHLLCSTAQIDLVPDWWTTVSAPELIHQICIISHKHVQGSWHGP